MTHDQLARRVAAREGISIRDARRVLGTVAAEISLALGNGEAVAIAGLGTFRPSRTVVGRTKFRSAAKPAHGAHSAPDPAMTEGRRKDIDASPLVDPIAAGRHA